MPRTRTVPSEPFPVNGLLPKEATQAATFLKKYPRYDGTGVRIAVLDTGVDPAAAGLSAKGKVVDIIDCTGAGDVVLESLKPISTTEDAITLRSPASGRVLLVSPSWSNPTGEWRVGTKRAFDLWPQELVKRREAERKSAFDVSQAALLHEAQQALLKIQASEGETKPETSPESTDAAGDSARTETAATDSSAEEAKAPIMPSDKPGLDSAQRKEELKARVQALKDLGTTYQDPGPLLECVVFHDGKDWRAVIGGGEGVPHDASQGWPDTQLALLADSTLDLRTEVPMTDYKREGQHGRFGSQDLLTFSVNILNEGNLLSLVTLAGSHGTHVAGIIGARYDEEPELNGVAPGCEIVSLKIGDQRLKSMETGQALLRAVNAIVTTGCDMANMSYGEDGAFLTEDHGAFAEALRDMVVRQRDVLFVSSAGNNGPALTTVGHPGGTTSNLLSVGAYVTSGAMQRAEYALVEDSVADSVTTWCSRGPTADGAAGVDTYAPGAAVTSIPQYCLAQSQLMNGTSMSSPNACGSIALLLSAMKAEGIPITPSRVYKAVRATGKDVSDPLGVGFLQVDQAWDHIVAHKDLADQDAEFRVRVTPPGKPVGRAATDRRGIYLREPAETQRVSQCNVTVRPTFKEAETERAYAIELRCALVATASWVKVPEFLLLGGNGRTFEVRVDPRDLSPGLHSARIEAYDSQRPGRKLFDVPVTVAKPELPAGPTVQYHASMSDGKVERRFLAVPEGATWAELRIRGKHYAEPGAVVRAWIHLVQLEPLQRLSQVEKAFVINLNEDEPITKKISVRGGMTLEVCLAQFWSNAAAFDLAFEIEFHGVSVSRVVTGRDDLTIVGGEGLAKVECQSQFRIEEFKPSVSFDKRRTLIRPSHSEIRPLTERDEQPSGRRLFELVTTYNIKLSEPTNTIAYSLPLSGNLYDAAVPMLAQLFDVCKKRVHFGDVYPKDVDLPKGDYVLKISMLHEHIGVLEKIKNMTLRVDQKLSKPKDVKLDLYESHVDVYGAAKPSTFGAIKLFPGERKMLCFDTNIEGESVPKEAKAGDILLGTFGFSGEGKTQLRYIVPPEAKKEKESEDSTSTKDKLPDLLVEGVYKKIKDDNEKNAFLEHLLAEYPEHLPVLVARLDALDPDKKPDEAIAAADSVLKLIDEDEILLFLGTKRPPASEQSKEDKARNKEMETHKDAVVLAYNRKSRALLAKSQNAGSNDFERTFERYRRYFGDAASASHKEFANVYIRWAMIHERYAIALTTVRKLIKDLGAGTSESADELRRARELEKETILKLGWSLWAANRDRHHLLNNPRDYAPF